MGKKRIVTQKGQGVDQGMKARSLARAIKRKLTSGVIHVESTFNNTKMVLADKQGNTLAWSSSGALGFKGAKKGTPFAAAKVGELLGEKAQMIGITEVEVIIKGIGSGRESAVRGFISKGIELSVLQDRTPVPHNGVRSKKARRV